jgi:hypothetical protein
MSIIDNTLAAQVPTFDAATPLKQAAQLQAADQEARQNAVQAGAARARFGARGALPLYRTRLSFPSYGLKRPTACCRRAYLPRRRMLSGAIRRRRCCSSR